MNLSIRAALFCSWAPACAGVTPVKLDKCGRRPYRRAGMQRKCGEPPRTDYSNEITVDVVKPNQPTQNHGFFGHPRGLRTLFFTEFWERFSYYGMRALLILFMTAPVVAGGLGMDTAQAGTIYGAYTALVYLAALPGGWFADRYLGARLAPLVTGWRAQGTRCQTQLRDWGVDPATSWHWGFAAAAVGMALGLAHYLKGWRDMGESEWRAPHTGDAAAEARLRRRLYAALVVFVLAVAGVLWSDYHGLLTASAMAAGVGYLLLLVTLGFFIWLFRAGTWSAAERKQLIAITVLFMAATVFWALFVQAGSKPNLFPHRITRKVIGRPGVPASWWQSLNSLYIILLAPLMAWLWVRLGPSDPSSPTKFTLGLFFAAAGFGVLAVAADLAADGVRVSPMWLALVYLLHTVGELCLSPIGLSAMTRLAPARIAGRVMGVWFLATSVGNYLGGQMASLYESFALPTLFTTITVVALIATLLMTAAVRPLARMISHKSN